MTTKSEGILTYVSGLLSNVSGVSGRVWRSRADPIRREETPAIIITQMQEVASYNLIDFVDWEMQFKVTVHARGVTPDNAADPVTQSVYAILMADRSLGGRAFDILPAGFYPQIIEGDQNILITDMVFTVRYRTKASDLTQ